MLSGDQLEAVLTTVNNRAQTQPAEAAHLGLIAQESAFLTNNVRLVTLISDIVKLTSSGCHHLDSVLRWIGVRFESSRRSPTRLATTLRGGCENIVPGHACTVPIRSRRPSLPAWFNADTSPNPCEELRHSQHASGLHYLQLEDAREARLQYIVVYARELVCARRSRGPGGQHGLRVSRR